MFEWNDKFSVGIDEIDKQHQRLFTIGKEVDDLLKYSNLSNKYVAIMEKVNELMEYTQYHFDYEEKMLEAKDYPDIGEQKEQHMKFIHYLVGIEITKNTDQQEVQLREILLFISKWIVDHITSLDKAYSDHMHQ